MRMDSKGQTRCPLAEDACREDERELCSRFLAVNRPLIVASESPDSSCLLLNLSSEMDPPKLDVAS